MTTSSDVRDLPRDRDDCSLELPKTFKIDRIPPGNENLCVHHISTLQDPSAMLRRREARAPIVNASNQRSQAHIVFRCCFPRFHVTVCRTSASLGEDFQQDNMYRRDEPSPPPYIAVMCENVRLGHQPVRPSGTERALLMMGPAEVHCWVQFLRTQLHPAGRRRCWPVG
ncbi:hypothetical protein VOLCADRAFT_98727 [Volvox carteri f. nagariensis]|uniref:Uncharacterized protein n=1 Tax=Volvox carteri f. nagariensis TaxID=3068 RepID=D8UG48_VOLCA|nr:uncharacterized protein VOLCADRAFT_98727 [Volvox carteri f. nagariensis]EFJ41313.1 hypothetical protein VOLCADRAFT_98727 [Volvox carteri f. nagariensis]|eukprot:XP_002957647.1 hypothetical protein VOLCADRAFT_98727 [Volvox carteri f. nagariensis]